MVGSGNDGKFSFADGSVVDEGKGGSGEEDGTSVMPEIMPGAQGAQGGPGPPAPPGPQGGGGREDPMDPGATRMLESPGPPAGKINSPI